MQKWQIEALSRPTRNTLRLVTEFYKDPKNEEGFREWYRKKYGKEPENDCMLADLAKSN